MNEQCLPPHIHMYSAPSAAVLIRLGFESRKDRHCQSVNGTKTTGLLHREVVNYGTLVFTSVLRFNRHKDCLALNGEEVALENIDRSKSSNSQLSNILEERRVKQVQLFNMKAPGSNLKVTVLGAKGVGKSAITVRYLTRRFIGEYSSGLDVMGPLSNGLALLQGVVDRLTQIPNTNLQYMPEVNNPKIAD
ncbi:hypothetical protein RRG08_017228 [Elysia crispata]|uniref:small monomeric GTPase n=1 Tax=Elysia crispata TaxID=231223 RepID=A0AAE0Z4I3_9GAST|nr:hypothetical protein RRG08_017228 [Elysia crispata]